MNSAERETRSLPSLHRRRWLHASGVLLVSALGCGTVLHPERRNQPHGRLDWGVVVLDGLGLLFFFIPGVIAFAVDFSTGAIYLPPEPSPGTVPTVGPLAKVETARPHPTVSEIEQAVAGHLGRPIKLAEQSFFSEPLANLREFWTTRERWETRDESAV